jgi:hypothetical protein
MVSVALSDYEAGMLRRNFLCVVAEPVSFARTSVGRTVTYSQMMDVTILKRMRVQS